MLDCQTQILKSLHTVVQFSRYISTCVLSWPFAKASLATLSSHLGYALKDELQYDTEFEQPLIVLDNAQLSKKEQKKDTQISNRYGVELLQVLK